MAHQLPDGWQVNTSHDKMAGVGVPEGMELCLPLDFGFLRYPDELAAKLLFYFATVRMREDEITLQAIIIFLPQAFQKIISPLVHRNLPLLRPEASP